MAVVLLVGNTNGVRIKRLRDALSDMSLNNLATVTGSLRDEAGAALSPAVAFTFDYVPATAGEYVAAVSGSGLVAGTRYLIFVEVNGGANLIGHFEFEAIAQARKKG